MALTALRIIILYIFATASVRIMGKRQIGELQPAELVVTILLSEIAAIPMQDNDIPILNSVIAIMLLVSFEIISSVITMKSPKIRKVLDGNPVMIIKNGNLDEKELKRLRFTVDDLLTALRQKDVFDISKVKYAFIETNGTLSVMLNEKQSPLTADTVDINPKQVCLPALVVSDGKYVRDYYSECNMDDKKIDHILKQKKINIKDVLIMTCEKDGKTTIIEKEKKV